VPTRSRPVALAWLVSIALLSQLSIWATVLDAQETVARLTGPNLARTHWAVVAVRRAEVMGLVGGYLPAQRLVPLEVVERALREAANRSVVELPSQSGLVTGWHRSLLEEFGVLARPDSIGRSVGLIGSHVSARFRHREDMTVPGIGEFEPHRSGAIPLRDRTVAEAGLDVSATLGESFGLRVAGAVATDTLDLETLELVAAWRGVRASAGRIATGYGHGFGGGVAFTGSTPLDVVQVAARAPFDLPLFLGVLGPVSFHTFLGRMWEERHPDEPYIWGASGQFQPHERLTLGVHRAAFFGGDPENQPVTLRRIMVMLIGDVTGLGFEDQIVSVSGRYRLPTEASLPLEVYLEWGSEDAAGGWWSVPGRVGGIWSPSLPFAPGVAAGVEVTEFAHSCCSNPSWYRHWSFVGSWVARDQTLGHPLGGNGTEFLAHAEADLAGGSLKVAGRGFRRNRGDENLFSPGRDGISHGGQLSGSYAPASGLRFDLEVGLETGSGWTERHLRLDGAYLF